jgi:hypothetical protein
MNTVATGLAELDYSAAGIDFQMHSILLPVFPRYYLSVPECPNDFAWVCAADDGHGFRRGFIDDLVKGVAHGRLSVLHPHEYDARQHETGTQSDSDC